MSHDLARSQNESICHEHDSLSKEILHHETLNIGLEHNDSIEGAGGFKLHSKNLRAGDLPY